MSNNTDPIRILADIIMDATDSVCETTICDSEDNVYSGNPKVTIAEEFFYLTHAYFNHDGYQVPKEGSALLSFLEKEHPALLKRIAARVEFSPPSNSWTVTAIEPESFGGTNKNEIIVDTVPGNSVEDAVENFWEGISAEVEERSEENSNFRKAYCAIVSVHDQAGHDVLCIERIMGFSDWLEYKSTN